MKSVDPSFPRRDSARCPLAPSTISEYLHRLPSPAEDTAATDTHQSGRQSMETWQAELRLSRRPRRSNCSLSQSQCRSRLGSLGKTVNAFGISSNLQISSGRTHRGGLVFTMASPEVIFRVLAQLRCTPHRVSVIKNKWVRSCRTSNCFRI